MATRSPVQIHNFWGASYATAAVLPNVGAGQTPLTLQAGDFAYVTGDATFYVCTNPGTVGGADATWVPMLSGTASDHFAPKYLVGNTQAPYNDSPVAYTSAGFRYIPDPGDGSGIALALSYANPADPAFVAEGDIWIRPGVYDLNGSGSPTIPMEVAGGTVVRGSGNKTSILARNIGNQSVFSMKSSSELRDLRINYFGASDPASAGVGLVAIDGISQLAPAWLHRVDFQLQLSGDVTTGLRCAVYVDSNAGNSCVVEDCRIFVSGNYTGEDVGGVCGVLSNGGTNSETSLFNVTISSAVSPPGFNCGVVASSASATIEASSLRVSSPNTVGVLSQASSSRLLLSDCLIDATVLSPGAVAVTCGARELNINNSRLNNVVGANAPGSIISTADRGVISGNFIRGDLDTSGGSNHVIALNLIQSGSTVTTSTTDEVAHNITYT